ncbi:MAG: hypothetical protein PHY95_03635 [Candidatus ainarchaeum sp.]|nr:hypothetical protein [Candidatus ainarchaeum sp.]
MKYLIGLLVIFGMLLSPAFAQLGCNPGTSECIDSTSYHVCTDYAVWGDAQHCGQDEECSDGQCMERLGCQPGTSECLSSNSYRVCGEHAIWNPTQYCSSGQTCSGGTCQPVPQCSYKDKRCSPTDGNEIQQCNSQGQWANWRHCSYGCSNGACKDCRRGDTQCYDDTHYQVCDSDGEWGRKKSCGSGYVCESGDCVQSAHTSCSTSGQTRCSPASVYELQRCSAGYWKDYTYCSDGCAYGMCVQCGTGNKQCVDSSHYQTCNSQGQWGSFTSCPSGQVCTGGSCHAPSGDECATPGAKRCSPTDANMIQQCGDNNAYVDYLQCAQGCLNSQCAECEAGTTACAGATSYRECSNGHLSDPIECAAGYTCDNGACIATPVCTDGQRNCVSNNVYSCTGSQWHLLLQCPTDNDCVESAGTAYCKAEQPVQPTQPTSTGGLGDLGIVFVGTTVVLAGAVVYFLFFRK